MKNIKFIIGVIISHILWYIFILYFDTYDIIFWLCNIIVWGYLLFIFLRKQSFQYCTNLNQWLIPSMVMWCIIQLPLYLILILGDSGLNFILYPLWLYRFTLFIELPLAYIVNKYLVN